MQNPLTKALALLTGILCLTSSATAQLVITEVHPTGNSNGNYASDWFELTNTGSLSLDITGYRMDDNSNSFTNSVALRGVTSIGAGQSIVFFEGNSTGTTDLALTGSFNSAWGTSFVFGTNIGAYGGSGVGLGSSGDAVNIFTPGGVLVTSVSFGASVAGTTFDNAALLSGTTISTLSVVGVNGAYSSNISEIGSPGVIPEPSSVALVVGGLVAGVLTIRRKMNR